MLHKMYSSLGAGIYPLLVLLQPVMQAIGGRCGYGFGQRLGRYPRHAEPDPGTATGPRLWLHAASVGEVQAASVLVTALLAAHPDWHLMVTSTTEQGHRLACARMPAGVCCLMAPLDLPQAVRRALRQLRPDCYICLETELWPVLLTEARKAGIPMLLLNGRLSQRSFLRYQYIRRTMAAVLDGFQQVAVIGEVDARRYVGLGLPAARIQVCGNLKYDMALAPPAEIRVESRRRLGIANERLLVCGSTHEGEEEQLLPVFRALAAREPAVWLLAPRHLERVAAVAALLRRAGLAFDTFSSLATRGRQAEVVLLDTMGDLADLYAGGDFIFCGGSLVQRGGHNIIEAARWGRAVYFGPWMKDFQDAAEMLINGGGGFQVADADELRTLLLTHAEQPEVFALACARAAEVSACQRGAVARQAALVERALARP